MTNDTPPNRTARVEMDVRDLRALTTYVKRSFEADDNYDETRERVARAINALEDAEVRR